jgi:transposase-like protein
MLLGINMTRNHEECLAILEKIRWNGNPKCPYCGSNKCRRLKNESRYQCNECFTSYSVTVGTIFHKTHVELHKWFIAITLIMDSQMSISVRQLAQKLGVNKNTACYMIERIRKAVSEEDEMLPKIIEIEN